VGERDEHASELERKHELLENALRRGVSEHDELMSQMRELERTAQEKVQADEIAQRILLDAANQHVAELVRHARSSDLQLGECSEEQAALRREMSEQQVAVRREMSEHDEQMAHMIELGRKAQDRTQADEMAKRIILLAVAKQHITELEITAQEHAQVDEMSKRISLGVAKQHLTEFVAHARSSDLPFEREFLEEQAAMLESLSHLTTAHESLKTRAAELESSIEISEHALHQGAEGQAAMLESVRNMTTAYASLQARFTEAESHKAALQAHLEAMENRRYEHTSLQSPQSSAWSSEAAAATAGAIVADLGILVTDSAACASSNGIETPSGNTPRVVTPRERANGGSNVADLSKQRAVIRGSSTSGEINPAPSTSATDARPTNVESRVSPGYSMGSVSDLGLSAASHNSHSTGRTALVDIAHEHVASSAHRALLPLMPGKRPPKATSLPNFDGAGFTPQPRNSAPSSAPGVFATWPERLTRPAVPPRALADDAPFSAVSASSVDQLRKPPFASAPQTGDGAAISTRPPLLPRDGGDISNAPSLARTPRGTMISDADQVCDDSSAAATQADAALDAVLLHAFDPRGTQAHASVTVEYPRRDEVGVGDAPSCQSSPGGPGWKKAAHEAAGVRPDVVLRALEAEAVDTESIVVEGEDSSHALEASVVFTEPSQASCCSSQSSRRTDEVVAEATVYIATEVMNQAAAAASPAMAS
jgi:hypothetical protein